MNDALRARIATMPNENLLVILEVLDCSPDDSAQQNAVAKAIRLVLLERAKAELIELLKMARE